MKTKAVIKDATQEDKESYDAAPCASPTRGINAGLLAGIQGHGRGGGGDSGDLLDAIAGGGWRALR